jgi:putative Mg2+ transporter-C (MgtC) family protein
MIAFTDILIRLGLAALLGSIIGLERQRHDWAAGLRTHMLVCVGSTLAMIVSMDGFGDVIMDLVM